MNTHWIYTVQGSVVIVALLAWPISEKDSKNLLDRIRFCLLSMLGGALLVWGFRQPPSGLHANMDFITALDGSVVAFTAAVFLIMLWFDKMTGMLTDLVIGCVDFPDSSSWDPKYETKQIEKAVQLYRRGRRHRALRLCHRIIESNNQYTSTASTLAYWIENPCTLRFHRPPLTALVFKGKFSSLNSLLFA